MDTRKVLEEPYEDEEESSDEDYSTWSDKDSASTSSSDEDVDVAFLLMDKEIHEFGLVAFANEIEDESEGPYEVIEGLMQTKVELSKKQESMTQMISGDLSTMEKEIYLQLKDAKPVRQRLRRMGQEQMEALREEVDKLLKAGFIVPVKTTEWLLYPLQVAKHDSLQWNDKCEEVFQEVKVLGELSAMQAPDWEQAFYVNLSVGDDAIGTMLLQKGKGSYYMRPVYCAIRVKLSYESGKISTKELLSRLWKDVYEERLTMSRTCKGDGMEPTIHSGEKVLVRKIPSPSTRQFFVCKGTRSTEREHSDICSRLKVISKLVWLCAGLLFVGDVVLLKDPSNADLERISRIAAMEGEEMVSTSESDMPFEIEKGACWVLLDNDSARARGEADSRNFGPLSLGNILGRVLYAYQSISDHGLVNNSKEAVREDIPVLMSELDLNELDKAE
ncbi:hypothetical protein L7F22_013577 [Adiantum nelumboides]|nr:hypothetical protein [Adiantum nelumboides]